MMNSNVIAIKLSKKKISFLTVACLGFVVFGIWGTLYPGDWISLHHRSETLIRISSILGVIFFGTILPFLIQKLFDSSPGLVINGEGIIVNTNITNLGLISWCNIRSVEKKTVASQKLLIVHVHDPKRIIDGEMNRIVKFFMEKNNQWYGTPLAITPNSLQISFTKLEVLLKEELAKRKS